MPAYAPVNTIYLEASSGVLMKCHRFCFEAGGPPKNYAARANSTASLSFAVIGFDLSWESPQIVYYRHSSVDTISAPSRISSV